MTCHVSRSKHCFSMSISWKKNKVHIGTIAETVQRDSERPRRISTFEPETIGHIMRLIGFTPKRDNKGKAIHITDRVRRRIHELAVTLTWLPCRKVWRNAHYAWKCFSACGFRRSRRR